MLLVSSIASVTEDEYCGQLTSNIPASQQCFQIRYHYVHVLRSRANRLDGFLRHVTEQANRPASSLTSFLFVCVFARRCANRLDGFLRQGNTRIQHSNTATIQESICACSLQQSKNPFVPFDPFLHMHDFLAPSWRCMSSQLMTYNIILFSVQL